MAPDLIVALLTGSVIKEVHAFDDCVVAELALDVKDGSLYMAFGHFRFRPSTASRNVLRFHISLDNIEQVWLGIVRNRSSCGQFLFSNQFRCDHIQPPHQQPPVRNRAKQLIHGVTDTGR